MFQDFESRANLETLSTTAVDDTLAAACVDHILAIVHLSGNTYVALIGHHTLSSLFCGMPPRRTVPASRRSLDE
jgi:hypothetical protein